MLHLRRLDTIGCVLTHDQMLHLLTGNGNEGIGYHFGPEFEKHITWKEMFFHCDTIQVCGNSPPPWNYYQVLHKIHDTPKCAAVFNPFASEVDGDRPSTIKHHIKGTYGLFIYDTDGTMNQVLSSHDLLPDCFLVAHSLQPELLLFQPAWSSNVVWYF